MMALNSRSGDRAGSMCPVLSGLFFPLKREVFGNDTEILYEISNSSSDS